MYSSVENQKGLDEVERLQEETRRRLDNTTRMLAVRLLEQLYRFGRVRFAWFGAEVRRNSVLCLVSVFRRRMRSAARPPRS